MPQKFRNIRQSHKDDGQPNNIIYVDAAMKKPGDKGGNCQPDYCPDKKNL
jgi:hypothetical protein